MDKTRRVRQVKGAYESVEVWLPGPYKNESAFTGKLLIIKEMNVVRIEWHPAGEIDSPERKCSPDSEALDWVDVSSSAPTIGYKSGAGNDSGAVEIRTPRLPNPISFEVSDVKAYRHLEVPDKRKSSVTFHLKDGTIIPALYFEPHNFLTFINSLDKYILFRQSTNDPTLFVVADPKEEALTKSFSELELFGDNKSHIVTKFFQDPYSTAMGGFSKVTNFLLDYIVYSDDNASSPRCSDEEVAELLHEGLSHIDISQQEEHGFEVIDCVELPPRPVVKRSQPVNIEEWLSHVDKDGRMHRVRELKQKIFRGGIIDSLRPEAWKFLLGYYSFRSSTQEREMVRRRKVDDYYTMKLQWRSMSPDQESRFAALRDRKSLIEKDVSRTDRIHPDFEGDNNSNVMMMYDILMTYCMHNFDLGYVQGMSDLLSPILVVMQNEAEAFWCFSGFLDRVGSNFEMDQQGMKTQLMDLHRLIHFVDPKFCSYLESHESGNLYFCFRWLLILFKRDFKFDEVMRLWEVLWTDLPCKNFHLLICIAILDTEKTTIMENNFGLTEVLKHINDMSYKIDLEETLCKAESIYLQIKSFCHTSDVIQDILGLRSYEECVSTAGQRRSSHSKEGLQNFRCYATLAGAHDQRDVSLHSDEGSIENIDDYVDLEQQYQTSLGNYFL